MLTSSAIARSAATALADGGTAKDRAQVPTHATKRFDAILHVIEIVLRDMPNADPATRVALARLTDALARIVNLPAQPQESLKDFTRRLAAHMDVLPQAARALIEKQLGQQSLLVALKVLIETLRPALSIELTVDLPLPHDAQVEAETVLENDGPVFRQPAIQVPLPTRPVFSQAPGVAPGAPHLQQALGQAFSPETPTEWTAAAALPDGMARESEEPLPAFREATAFLASDSQALAQAVAIAKGHTADMPLDLLPESPARLDAPVADAGTPPDIEVPDIPDKEPVPARQGAEPAAGNGAAAAPNSKSGHSAPDAVVSNASRIVPDAPPREKASEPVEQPPASTETDHRSPDRTSRETAPAVRPSTDGAEPDVPEAAHSEPPRSRPPLSQTAPERPLAAPRADAHPDVPAPRQGFSLPASRGEALSSTTAEPLRQYPASIEAETPHALREPERQLPAEDQPLRKDVPAPPTVPDRRQASQLAAHPTRPTMPASGQPVVHQEAAPAGLPSQPARSNLSSSSSVVAASLLQGRHGAGAERPAAILLATSPSADDTHPARPKDTETLGSRPQNLPAAAARPDPQALVSFGNADIPSEPPLSPADVALDVSLPDPDHPSSPLDSNAFANQEDRLGTARSTPEPADKRTTVLVPTIDVALLTAGAPDLAQTMGQFDEWETLFYMLSGSLGDASEPAPPETTHVPTLLAGMESDRKTAPPQSPDLDMLTPSDENTAAHAAGLPTASDDPVPATPLARGMESFAVREAIAFAFVPYLPAGDHPADSEDEEGLRRDRDTHDEAKDRRGKENGDQEDETGERNDASLEEEEAESRDAYDLYRRLSDLA